MALGEFELIRRYFGNRPPRRPGNRLGIGDDCALLEIPAGYQLAVTTDTMVENVHFFAGTDPCGLGHKLMAVNLSDLAAMGAEPQAATLALTLPCADADWLAAFAAGFLGLADRYQVDLIGGDTTSGPMTLTMQALGLVPAGQALLRSTARPGDRIYVTGPIGNAGLGLKIHQGYPGTDPEQVLAAFNRPQPRVAEGLALRGVASACIDISDGLAADLGHILTQSRVGACLELDSLPLSPAVRAYLADTGDWQMPLTAGDDYELCFTAAGTANLPAGCQCIGRIEELPGLRLKRGNRFVELHDHGYEHFS